MTVMPVLAYLGPGLGAGVVAAILGVITAFFLAVVGIVWYPIKRMLRKRRKAESETATSDTPATELSADGDPPDPEKP